MGANQSQDGQLGDGDEDDYFEDAHSPIDTKGGLTAPSGKPASTAVKSTCLYQHKPSGKWVTALKKPVWKFSQLGSEDEAEEDEDDDKWRKRREESDQGGAQDWYLIVGSKVQALVGYLLGIRFNDDELRVDFVAGSVWALRFGTVEEYKSFVSQYMDCSFENSYNMEATPANRVKVLGKDFLHWAAGQDPEESMWDAEEAFETHATPPRPPKVRETYSHSASKGVQSLSMGALKNSYLLHEGGVDVYRNMEEGIDAEEGLTISMPKTSGSPYVTPKKGLLMRRETNMMLMTPLQSMGVQQMDVESGKIVANWQFEKDGTPISMRDIIGDSKGSQLDATESTFLGLDDNRLCRWDMRDRHGMVQQLASPVLAWSDGHQFSRGTNFQCFASTGDGCVAVGSKDGKVRLYSTTTMRVAKTSFPSLGSPITHIDATFDGKWVLATTDTYLMVFSTAFKDKDGKEKSGFGARMGGNISAPRVLKLSPIDAHSAGSKFKFQGAQFSWVTESGRHERNIVASIGQFSVVWNFRRVKQSEHQCYRVGEGLKTCYCYKIVPKEENVIESRFMHDDFVSNRSPEAPLVVATPAMVSSFNV